MTTQLSRFGVPKQGWTPRLLAVLLSAFAGTACNPAGAREAVQMESRSSTRMQDDPVVVVPGASIMNADGIEPFYADAGRFNITFRRTQLGGESLLSVETHLVGSGLPGVDYMALDRATLGLRMRNTAYLAFGGHHLTVIVEGRRARGAFVPYADSASFVFDQTMDVEPFEEFLLGWVLATLPLEIGSTFRLPTLAPTRDGGPFKIRWFDAEVTGVESREAYRGGQAVDTKVVQARADDGTSDVVFWLSSDPPYVVRRELTGGGRTSSMEFLSVDRLE